MIAQKIKKFNSEILALSVGEKCFYAALFLIAAAALVTRLLVVFKIPNTQMYDFEFYYSIAVNIAQGRGHTYNGVPVAWQGCGYPYALGLFMRLFGVSETSGKLFNVILSELTLCVSYFIFRKFFAKKGQIIACFAIVACLPTYVLYVNVLGTEIFYVFLLSLIIFTQLYIKDEKIRLPLLGVLIGLSSLTKPFMLAYPVICAVSERITTGKFLPALRCLAVTFTVTAMVIAPWTYRNYRHYGRFIPISYNAGYCSFINSNDTNVKGSWLDLAAVENPYVQSRLGEFLTDGKDVKTAWDLEPLLKAEARKWIVAHPLEYAKLGVLRVKSTFFMGANDIYQWSLNNITLENSTKPANLFYRDQNVLSSFFDFSVTALNIFGIFFAFSSIKKLIVGFFKRNAQCPPITHIVSLNILFQIAVVFAFEGQARYAFPTFLFSACALVYMLKPWGSAPNPAGDKSPDPI